MKETKIAKRKKKRSLIITTTLLIIVMVAFVFGMLKFVESMEKGFEARAKLNCADYFLEDVYEDLNFIQLCENEECQDYFNKNIEFSLEMAGECLK